MIDRKEDVAAVRKLLRSFPVVCVLGARQVGKTTLAREVGRRFAGRAERFDLESSEDLARLEDPMLALKPLRGLVIIDEIQRRSGLFEPLRVLADRRPLPARFLVLGSASPGVLRQSSESLAGRIAYHTLEGLRIEDVGSARLDRLWLRGGFPSSFLARTNDLSLVWRRNFVRTFVERDLPQLGFRIEAQSISRFWSMLAHYHAQVWNAAEFASSFGLSDKSVRHYLDILEAALVLRVLKPWSENIGRRQVKAPKVFVRDSGLLHTLLGIRDARDLERHPKLGASWEGFILQQVIAHLGAEPEECFFWATHGGADLDFLFVRGRTRIGVEVKRTSAPRLTRSIASAIDVLKLKHVYLVHAGEATFPLNRNVTAVASARLTADL